MRTLKYFLLTLIVSCLYACTAEEIVTPDSSLDIEGNETAVIAISSKDLLPVDMNKTRADLNSILSKVNDLNICVHLNDGNHVFYYCTDNKIVRNPSSNTKDDGYIGSNNLTNINGTDGTKIHLDILASQIKKIEIIANNGKAITKFDTWQSVQETESNNFLAQNYCMMYGVATTSTTDNTHTISGKQVKCKLFNISLKRTRAMVSVKINCKGLNKGVEIAPTKISLYNVPTSCTLNKLFSTQSNGTIETIGTNKITKIQESQEISQEKTFDGNTFIDNNKSTFGGHIGEPNFIPLYLFENMQGTNTYKGAINNVGNPDYTGQILKFPDNNWKTIADSKDRNKNFKYSYIQIEAKYHYKEGTSLKHSGDIIYRFFLGNDATQDFNIEGNHYYKLTLNLSGFGGAKEDGKIDKNQLVINDKDASWRVDLATKDWGFEQSEFDFDSHFTEGNANVIGDSWSFDGVFKEDGTTKLPGYESWVVLKIKQKNGNITWDNPTNITSGKNLVIENNKVFFQVEPMNYQGYHNPDPSGAFMIDSHKKSNNYRAMKIRIKHEKDGQTQTITIKQYVPITVRDNNGNVLGFMERFEEYDNNIIGFPWKYENNTLNSLKASTQSMEAYTYGESISRVDVGENTYKLSQKGSKEPEYKQAAAYHCYVKGLVGFQGGEAQYYALPSQNMLKAMFNYVHDNAWGPFEPLYSEEDYWTSSVLTTHKTETQYYDSKSKTFKSTSQRNLPKRVRAIYTAQYSVLK